MEGSQISSNICTFYNEKKSRKCKMQIYKDNKYCIAHLNDPDLMMDCPVDPSHKVIRDRIEKHLKICNKIKGQKLI